MLREDTTWDMISDKKFPGLGYDTISIRLWNNYILCMTFQRQNRACVHLQINQGVIDILWCNYGTVFLEQMAHEKCPSQWQTTS